MGTMMLADFSLAVDDTLLGRWDSCTVPDQVLNPFRVAFVMEQTLGHVTHYQNLRKLLADQEDVVPTWLPIPFGAERTARFLPVYRDNWSVRASWRARRALRTALAARPHDAVLFHTQVAALFARPVLSGLPSI